MKIDSQLVVLLLIMVVIVFTLGAYYSVWVILATIALWIAVQPKASGGLRIMCVLFTVLVAFWAMRSWTFTLPARNFQKPEWQSIRQLYHGNLTAHDLSVVAAAAKMADVEPYRVVKTGVYWYDPSSGHRGAKVRDYLAFHPLTRSRLLAVSTQSYDDWESASP